MFLLTLVMLRRVAVAVACIKVASQAVSTMPSILLFPLLPFILEVGPGSRGVGLLWAGARSGVAEGWY